MVALGSAWIGSGLRNSRPPQDLVPSSPGLDEGSHKQSLQPVACFCVWPAALNGESCKCSGRKGDQCLHCHFCTAKQASGSISSCFFMYFSAPFFEAACVGWMFARARAGIAAPASPASCGSPTEERRPKPPGEIGFSGWPKPAEVTSPQQADPRLHNGAKQLSVFTEPV